jgi:hypothetical protein
MSRQRARGTGTGCTLAARARRHSEGGRGSVKLSSTWTEALFLLAVCHGLIRTRWARGRQGSLVAAQLHNHHAQLSILTPVHYAPTADTGTATCRGTITWQSRSAAGPCSTVGDCGMEPCPPPPAAAVEEATAARVASQPCQLCLVCRKRKTGFALTASPTHRHVLQEGGGGTDCVSGGAIAHCHGDTRGTLPHTQSQYSYAQAPLTLSRLALQRLHNADATSLRLHPWHRLSPDPCPATWVLQARG